MIPIDSQITKPTSSGDLPVFSRIDARIFRSPFVPLLAVGLSPFLHSGGLTANTNADSGSKGSLSVNSWRDGFKVLRIDTASDATEMVYFQVGRNTADVQFIRKAVSGSHRAVSATNMNSRITATIDMAQPQPTSGVWLRRDHLQETLKQRLELRASWHTSILAQIRKVEVTAL